MKFALFFLAAALLGLVFTGLLIRKAPEWGLMDHPGGRKLHAAPVPLVGGLGLFLACIAVIPFTDLPGPQVLAWMVASVLIIGIGVADDLRDLPPHPKFAMQIAAALIMALGADLQLTDLGNLFGFGAVALGVLAVPFTVFAVVGVMNAMNMCDGTDGLAGGIAFIAVLWFAVAAAVAGDIHYFDGMAALWGALFAFLLLNLRTRWRQRAAVFMGDSGSLFVGFMLAWLAVELAESPDPAMPAMTAVWILALPITDTLVAMLRRLARGQSPFRADREHLHHILAAAGFTDREAVAMLLFVSTLCGAIGVWSWVLGVPEHLMFVAYLGLFGVHLVALTHAWELVKFIRRGPRQHGLGREPPPESASLVVRRGVSGLGRVPGRMSRRRALWKGVGMLQRGGPKAAEKPGPEQGRECSCQTRDPDVT